MSLIKWFFTETKRFIVTVYMAGVKVTPSHAVSAYTRYMKLCYKDFKRSRV